MAKVKQRKKKKAVVRRSGVDTQTQLYQRFRRHGARPSQAALGSAIMMAESGGRWDAFNGANSDGSWDAGIGQINSIHGYSRQFLFDPDNNMEAIKKISNNFTNWSPWVAFTTGSYRQFVNRGKALMKAKNQKGSAKTGGVPATKSGGASAAAAAGPAMTAEQSAAVASFAGGLPGTELTGLTLPPGIGGLGLPGLPDEITPDLGDITQLPTAIEDSFRLFNHLFEAQFWYKVGKVVLGLAALGIGINAVVKVSTGMNPVGAAKRTAATAASVAATKGKGMK